MYIRLLINSDFSLQFRFLELFDSHVLVFFPFFSLYSFVNCRIRLKIKLDFDYCSFEEK